MSHNDGAVNQAADAAPAESISALLKSANEGILAALIGNPELKESHISLLLERKDLSGSLIEEIAKRKTWLANYQIRFALAAHPRTPRLIAMRLLRDLHLMDLVKISVLNTSTGELRRLAEERVLSQLPQLPLGQKLTLARRGSSRIAAGLVVAGPERVTQTALDNAFLTESQLLKTLAKDDLSARAVAAVAGHGKWSQYMNIRIAVLRHPDAPIECTGAFIPDLPRREIEGLLDYSQLIKRVRIQLGQELQRRGKK